MFSVARGTNVNRIFLIIDSISKWLDCGQIYHNICYSPSPIPNKHTILRKALYVPFKSTFYTHMLLGAFHLYLILLTRLPPLSLIYLGSCTQEIQSLVREKKQVYTHTQTHTPFDIKEYNTECVFLLFLFSNCHLDVFLLNLFFVLYILFNYGILVKSIFLELTC